MKSGDRFKIVWDNDKRADSYTILNDTLTFLSSSEEMWWCVAFNGMIVCINPKNSNIHALIIEQQKEKK